MELCWCLQPHGDAGLRRGYFGESDIAVVIFAIIIVVMVLLIITFMIMIRVFVVCVSFFSVRDGDLGV